MPDGDLRSMAEISIKHDPIVYHKLLFLNRAPLLSRAESAKLVQSNRQVVRSEGDGKLWCTLAHWLADRPADDGVLCRKTGLEIEIAKREGLSSDINLLPFMRNYPVATLEYTFDGQVKRRTLRALFSSGLGTLKLVLPFLDPSASAAAQAEGLNLYGEVVDALSSPDGVRLSVKYGHQYRTKIHRPPDEEPIFHIGLPPGTGVIFLPEPVRMMPAVVLNAAEVGTPQPRVDLREIRRDERTAELSVATLNRKDSLRIREDQLVQIQKFRHIAVPPTTVQLDERTVDLLGHTTSNPMRIQRPLSREDTFPDLHREAQQGWGSLAGPRGTLYFRDTSRGDTFQYLPTHFKLGFHVESDGSTGRPPMRPEFYEREGEYRVKVTLVAVPWIEDADREALRSHLREDVLLGTLPFVRLEPAGGLTAEFLPTFTAATDSGQVSLPASIEFTALDVDLNDRVLLEFDMEAPSYSIFAEMVRHGLHGKVKVSAEGLIQESIPVRLSLEDIAALPRQIPGEADGLADGVFIWQLAETGAGDDDEPHTELTVLNTLDRPVAVSSLKVHLVDSGPIAGMIFDSEEIDLAPGGKTLAASGDPEGGDRVAVELRASRIALWDETVPVPGSLRVEGGTADDWLDRVHQDPSLTEAELAVTLRLVLPSDVGDLQIVRLRLFEAGSAQPRQSRDVLPTADPVELPIRLTLDELAGRDGAAPEFQLEFDGVHESGAISLAQRVPIEPDGGTVLLRPVIAGDGAAYTLEPSNGPRRDGLSRDEAASALEPLRAAGATWTVLARAPEPGDGPDDPPIAEGPTVTPPASGTDVQIVTDLLAPSFADGTLQSVFVTLSPDADGARTDTFAFDAADSAARVWTPPAGVPPFRYKVTYVFGGGVPARRVEGSESQPLLLLDP